MKKLTIELLEIIKLGEGITNEFKEVKEKLPENLFETICAFLNRFGGNIFLGIKDNGEIVGVSKEYITSLKKDFANLFNNNVKINPTIYLNISNGIVELQLS